ncbi:signal recognition particle-docking protein FtsY [archaeon]|nr:signal recognition particle-docking protein FtsY [archaeon]
MFDFLKKKITNFTDKLKGSVQKTGEEPKEIQEEIDDPIPEKIETQKKETREIPEKTMEREVESPAETEEIDTAGENKEAIEKVKKIRKDDKRELKAQVGLGKKLFGFIGGKIKISENETKEFFNEFELSLLESDVEQETAEAITNELRERLIGKEISAKENLSEFLKKEVKESLQKIMETKTIDLLSMKQKPLKILFLGPNGAGKTTSIAKIAKYFLDNKKSVIVAAGDTFRAASIEQLEEHAKNIGVKVIKHQYGADPAAVGFDAVKAAEAKKIDVVLIDTAGRQDTNKNLLEELKKIDRVVKPDLKLYVGEAYTGQALLQQASEFNDAIGIDGFVLTKIDTDTKGGTAISLLYKLKKPILFVGTGQRYEDLLEFKPEFIIDRII